MIKKESRNEMRVIRHKRIRKSVIGTNEVPRLCVYRSNNNISAQLIDDEKHVTICSASSVDKDLKENDIIIMCSDGIIESNTECKNKELWLKELLENLKTDDVQKISDIILQEAIDNGFGIAKDDMTVIVLKISTRKKK